MGPWSSLPRSSAPTRAPATWPPSSPREAAMAASISHADRLRETFSGQIPSVPVIPVVHRTSASPLSSRWPPASSFPRYCFFSIEFRKRSECEDSFDYVGSSSSWIHSSSKRDLRQDDPFFGCHYYHCHGSCLVSIIVSLPTTCLSGLQKCHDKPLNPFTSQQTIVCLCYRLLSPSYNVASCRCKLFPCVNMDILLLYRNIIAI